MATTLKMGTLQISSPAFDDHSPIPRRYASDGENISPPIRWMGIPPGTKELALVCFDPDAPTPRMFTHWVVYRISPDRMNIEEGQSGKNSLTEGTNGTGSLGYTGPAPPPGNGLHHYYFCLYALDANLDSLVQAGLTREQLLEEIGDHVIQMARFIGTYEKQ